MRGMWDTAAAPWSFLLSALAAPARPDEIYLRTSSARSRAQSGHLLVDFLYDSTVSPTSRRPFRCAPTGMLVCER